MRPFCIQLEPFFAYSCVWELLCLKLELLLTILEDRILYSGGTDSWENFTAKFSASAPVVYKSPPPMGPEILYTTGAGKGVKVSVAIFPSSGGGV